MALAHADDDQVRGAYNSALYISARRRMLQNWADHLETAVVQAEPSAVEQQSSEIAANRGGPGDRHSFYAEPELALPYWQRQPGQLQGVKLRLRHR